MTTTPTTTSPTALATGCNPDTPDGDTILLDAVRNLVALSRHLATTCGGRELAADGVHCSDLGSAIPFLNRAVLTRPPAADLPIQVDGLRDFYGADRDPAQPALLVSPWPLPDLASAGFVVMGHPPFMVRPSGPTTLRNVAGLEVCEVASAAELEALHTTVVEAYPVDVPGADRPVLTPEALGGGLRLWLGRYEGRPVATALSYVAHGVNQIEWISTRPEVRGRGIGAAITAAAVDAAPELPAVLTSSDLGRPVYERLGFLPICRFDYLLFGRLAG